MRIGVLGLMDTSHLLPHAPEGVTLVIYPPRITAFPHTPYDRLLVDLAHVDAAERAAADGVDAILIDSTCDWGIEAIRAVVDVPVAGAGEVGIAEASAGGRRFGIVTIWPPALEFIYTEWARTVPGGERCTGIRVRVGRPGARSARRRRGRDRAHRTGATSRCSRGWSRSAGARSPRTAPRRSCSAAPAWRRPRR
jgi:hypothetical protein